MINQQVNIDELLVQNDIEYKPISAKYYFVLIINALISFVLITSIPIVFYYFDVITLINLIWIIGAIFVLFSLRMIIIRWAFKYRGYAIRTYDVLFRRGIISIEETIVPYNRVQHVKLRRGFISKLFGLSDLLIYTAAGNNFNLNIAGLHYEEAEQIKSYIINKLTNDIPVESGPVIKELLVQKSLEEAVIKEESVTLDSSKDTNDEFRN